MPRDIQRLYGAEFLRNSAWLSTIQLTDFFEGVPADVRRKARAELSALYPNSTAAEELAYATAGSLYPKNATPEQEQAYWRQRWQALLPLARKWPASRSIAGSVTRAVAYDPGAKPEQVAEIMALFKRAIQLDPDGLRTSPPEPT